MIAEQLDGRVNGRFVCGEFRAVGDAGLMEFDSFLHFRVDVIGISALLLSVDSREQLLGLHRILEGSVWMLRS